MDKSEHARQKLMTSQRRREVWGAKGACCLRKARPNK
jgi:hypothetical protein